MEHRLGKTSVMVPGFNVSTSQVAGSGDNLVEQARPVLQVEDIREATGSEVVLLDSRDHGFFTVDRPTFFGNGLGWRGICAAYGRSLKSLNGSSALLSRTDFKRGSARLNFCPSARMGVQAEKRRRRDPAGTERSDRSWVEGVLKRVGGEAPKTSTDLQGQSEFIAEQ